MAKKSKFQLDEDQIMDLEDVDQSQDKSIATVSAKTNMNPRSLANLRPRAKGKTDKKYMQLDIMGFEDYLNKMSKYNKMTRTKYIQELIRKDAEAHKEEYKLLQELGKLSSKK